MFLTLDITRWKPTFTVTFAHPRCHRPKDCTLEILIDTSANVTIISQQNWPPSWPVICPSHGFMGVGGVANTQQSVVTVTCTDEDGGFCHVRPYMSPIPISLLGRDVLSQINCVVKTSPQGFQDFSQWPLKSDQYSN